MAHSSTFALLTAILLTAAARAQFELQDSTTTADLRGVSAPGNGVAWASGTHGTVVRTEDGGYMWQGCAVPPGAEQLDFRGIQAFDDRTALVMSSGKGPLSRIYKTTDGCQSWKLVFTDPDADGFFDAMQLNPPGSDANNDYGVLIGDPVGGAFAIFLTYDRGSSWERMKGPPAAHPGEALFAASNQALVFTGFPNSFGFVTGGTSGARFLRFEFCGDDYWNKGCSERWDNRDKIFKTAPLMSPFAKGWEGQTLRFPLAASGGAFAIAAAWRGFGSQNVIVGGDYASPTNSARTANWDQTTIGRNPWKPAQTPPHGYRSSVAYDAPTKTWITVGPNGTDISTDDGRNWRPLRPMPGDTPGADANWNALALPWVVGPHGRIGKLHADALNPSSHR